MITTAAPPIGRIADLVCARHQAAILFTQRWPRGLEIGPASNCAGCRAAAADADGAYAAHDRKEHDVRGATAEHEAAHAVANVMMGHAVDWVELTEWSGDPWDGENGLVCATWSGASGRFGAAVAHWAGPLGHHAALARRGVVGRRNIIGYVYTARNDTDWLAARCTAEESERARHVAADLVRDRAADIVRLGAALEEKGWLSAGDVLALIGPRR